MPRELTLGIASCEMPPSQRWATLASDENTGSELAPWMSWQEVLPPGLRGIVLPYGKQNKDLPLEEVPTI